MAIHSLAKTWQAPPRATRSPLSMSLFSSAPTTLHRPCCQKPLSQTAQFLESVEDVQRSWSPKPWRCNSSQSGPGHKRRMRMRPRIARTAKSSQGRVLQGSAKRHPKPDKVKGPNIIARNKLFPWMTRRVPPSRHFPDALQSVDFTYGHVSTRLQKDTGHTIRQRKLLLHVSARLFCSPEDEVNSKKMSPEAPSAQSDCFLD